MEPAQTLRFWNGLPPDFKAIDAAYERANDSQIVFFIGECGKVAMGGVGWQIYSEGESILMQKEAKIGKISLRSRFYRKIL